MSRRPFRVEVNYPVGRRPQYFLTRDVSVGDRRAKVRKYLGTKALEPDQVEQYRKAYAPEMEYRAALKRADLLAAQYSCDFLSRSLLLDVERVKSIYNGVQGLLTVNEIEAYETNFEISYVQGTTAIEGNTLSIREARNLLVDSVPPEGKTLREINEVQNFRKVATYRSSYKRKITLDFIRHIHALVMNNIDLESAGSFRRRDDLGIIGTDVVVARAEEISRVLTESIEKYYAEVHSSKHPFESAAVFHYQFELIHPFTDGNGRVGREVFNYLLTRSHYPRLLFLGKDRARYLECLKAGNEGNFSKMVAGFARLIVDQRLNILAERLKAAAVPRTKVGQTRLSDWVTS